MQSYEGTVRSPGTHRVIGTVLVRTSEDLTTAKQKELEQAIIDALTYIEEDDSNKEPVAEEKPADTKPVDNNKASQPQPSNTQNNSQQTTSSQNSTTEETNNIPVQSTINKNQEAVKAAEEIATFYATVDPSMVKEILMNDYGFTETQAYYATANASIDWNFYAVSHIEMYVGMNEENGLTKEKIETYMGAELRFSTTAINYAFENANIILGADGFYHYNY